MISAQAELYLCQDWEKVSVFHRLLLPISGYVNSKFTLLGPQVSFSLIAGVEEVVVEVNWKRC